MPYVCMSKTSYKAVLRIELVNSNESPVLMAAGMSNQGPITHEQWADALVNIWHQDQAALMTISWQAIGSDHLHTLTQSFATHHSVNTGLPFYMSRVSEEFTIGRYASVHSIFLCLLKVH